ncbi:MAG: YifB family Mg chelatase-like AAA ATPase [Patescibacteria group bacterium]
MNFSKVYSAQHTLLTARIVTVEVDLSRGLHAFTVVGLPDKGVEESKDRVSSAIKNSGWKSPKSRNQKIVVSLAPANLKKEGPMFDLPIALAYLLASEDIVFSSKEKLFVGELSLDGAVRRVNGILPLIAEARKQGLKQAFVPFENVREAAFVEGIEIFPVHTLKEVVEHLDLKEGARRKLISPYGKTEISYIKNSLGVDFSDIKGQETAKRGLEIAAAGGHNIAMYGPPGTGKTMLAKAFCNILPPLSAEKIFETTSVHSIAGVLKDDLVTAPPFRSPHHTASYVSLVGGGTTPKPGEVTLAHNGVLFLDEFPEFESRVIDALREPLEERVVRVSRARGSAEFPARFILIAAMNPCPCGFWGVRGKNCVCSPMDLIRYKRKISGPIVDRIDIWVEVSHIDHSRLMERGGEEENNEMFERVLAARRVQKERFSDWNINIDTNSELGARNIIKLIGENSEAKKILDDAAQRLMLSPRMYHRLIKVARTIADLEGMRDIEERHMLEALAYRPKREE